MRDYSNVLKRIDNIEYLWGINYLKPDGTFCFILKILYAIIGVYTLCINLFYVIGVLLTNTSHRNLNFVQAYLIATTVASILLIGSFFIMRFNKKLWTVITSCVVNLVSCFTLIITFAVQLEDVLGFGGYKTGFYWRHFIPLCLMIILTVVLTFIALRAIFIRKKSCETVCEMVQKIYGFSLEDNDLTLEQWQEFIKNNNPKNYKKQFQDI